MSVKPNAKAKAAAGYNEQVKNETGSKIVQRDSYTNASDPNFPFDDAWHVFEGTIVQSDIYWTMSKHTVYNYIEIDKYVDSNGKSQFLGLAEWNFNSRAVTQSLGDSSKCK